MSSPSASAGIDVDHIRADSVVDLAYGRIRALVLEGEILPGTRLGQVELAERLGISRTPVREALRRLAVEGEWRDADVAEHRAITAAVAEHDGDRATGLTLTHVTAALRHWADADAVREPA